MSKVKMPKIIEYDIWLAPYQKPLEERIRTYDQTLNTVAKEYGGLLSFSNAHRFLGFNYDEKKKGWDYREWAPEADALWWTVDFNAWSRQAILWRKHSS